MTSPLNVLLLFSDEHRKDAAGCYGHPLVKTPNLDALAARGCRFNRAYTSSPVCVPARASMATGQYVHKTRCWSNSQAYQGQLPSFGHRLQMFDRRVESIGKLHYRGSEFDNGFDRELLPLYIKDGKGWIKGLLRDHESVLDCSTYATEIGPGEDSYTEYDLGVTNTACEWLTEQSQRGQNTPPWMLFVSWLRPHYPLTCPSEFYDLYPLEKLDQARFTSDNERSSHPVNRIMARNFDYDRHFNQHTRQVARASYYGLCSFLDHQVGRVMEALEKSGMAENTLVIYTSDHGDHNGDRGLWTKMTLFDESAAIPMLMAGPGIPAGTVVETPTSLVDIYPTVLSASGVEDDKVEKPGRALQDIALEADTERGVLSEYHDGGSPTGLFMYRNRRWKYNCFPGYAPQLFDMQSDPGELQDLAGMAEYAEVERRCHDELYSLVDAEKQNQNAFEDQRRLIEKLGGEKAILSSEEFDFTPVGS